MVVGTKQRAGAPRRPCYQLPTTTWRSPLEPHAEGEDERIEAEEGVASLEVRSQPSDVAQVEPADRVGAQLGTAAAGREVDAAAGVRPELAVRNEVVDQ